MELLRQSFNDIILKLPWLVLYVCFYGWMCVLWLFKMIIFIWLLCVYEIINSLEVMFHHERQAIN